jgi:hypothetical protein
MRESAEMVTVKLRYIYRDTDRHGNARVYFWRKGGRKVRIRESLGSRAFFEVYRKLLADGDARLQPQAKSAAGPSPALTAGCVCNISPLRSSGS